jgi:hypothetical protein
MPKVRILRGPPPKKKIRPHNIRKVALPALRRDFKDRCAYSMQHMDLGGGLKTMEVDHHDASLATKIRNAYDNLFLSSRHCNNSKLNRPTYQDKKEGKRFLNPCKELDYDYQIFEDPRDHHVWGTTAEARYHIIYCDLNAPHLRRERSRRTAIKTELNARPAKIESSFETFGRSFTLLKQERDLMIHDIQFKVDPDGLLIV